MDRDAEAHRRALEQQADIIRARLSATLTELDRRRHEIFNLPLQAQRHPLPALGVGALLGVTAFAGGAFAVYRTWQAVAARRSPVHRVLRGLRRPLLLLAPPPPSLSRRLVSSALTGAVSALCGALIRRLLVPRPGGATGESIATQRRV